MLLRDAATIVSKVFPLLESESIGRGKNGDGNRSDQLRKRGATINVNRP
jgi:hypothetical protein